MGIKKLKTINPTHYITDKKGKKIAVFRGGQLDMNAYAKLTPSEKEANENMGNPDYKPSKPK